MDTLLEQTRKLGIENSVRFFGKVNHAELREYLAHATAMLIYTRKDNNMISVVEAIACATPVVTTGVPYNAAYIQSNRLGIVNDVWGANDLREIAENNAFYVNNCIEYSKTLSDERRVEQFLEL